MARQYFPHFMDAERDACAGLVNLPKVTAKK